MRIRKRFQNSIPPPDLSSPFPPSTAGTAAAAAAVAPSVATAAGSKEGEAAPGAAAAAAAASRLAHGSSGGSGGFGGSDDEGRGLHSNGDLAASLGCTTKLPAFRLPFLHRPPPEAATAEGQERGNLSPPGARLSTGDVSLGYGWEVLKREKDDGEEGADEGAYGRWNADAHSGGAGAAAPKRSGAEVSKLPQLGHGGNKSTLPNGTTAAEGLARWSDEEKGFHLKKRRDCYRAGRGRKLQGGDDDEESAAAAERVVVIKLRPNKTRRRTAPSIAATGTALPTTTVLCDNKRGALAAAVAGAPKKCEDTAVKEEGESVPSAVEALAADGSRGAGGNGKKRRSPAVLMEGSRCSRVNGRGWRCCQQTLVGYSLCEHHLGKGRLRSVSSVRCNGRAKKKEEADGAAASTLLSPLPSPVLEQQDEEEIKPRKRRNKIGMVKARSISSLLHQADYPTPLSTALAALPPEPCLSPFPAPTAAAALSDHDEDGMVA